MGWKTLRLFGVCAGIMAASLGCGKKEVKVPQQDVNERLRQLSPQEQQRAQQVMELQKRIGAGGVGQTQPAPAPARK